MPYKAPLGSLVAGNSVIVGLGTALGVGEGVGVGVAVGFGVGVTVGDGFGVWVGDAVGVGDAEAFGVGDPVGVGDPTGVGELVGELVGVAATVGVVDAVPPDPLQAGSRPAMTSGTKTNPENHERQRMTTPPRDPTISLEVTWQDVPPPWGASLPRRTRYRGGDRRTADPDVPNERRPIFPLFASVNQSAASGPVVMPFG
jgi:hypothetical protein